MSRYDPDRKSTRQKLPKGYAVALAASRRECGECWTVGGHDPLCSKVKAAANARAAKVTA